jgi:hypothetical protein
MSNQTIILLDRYDEDLTELSAQEKVHLNELVVL